MCPSRHSLEVISNSVVHLISQIPLVLLDKALHRSYHIVLLINVIELNRAITAWSILKYLSVQYVSKTPLMDG